MKGYTVPGAEKRRKAGTYGVGQVLLFVVLVVLGMTALDVRQWFLGCGIVATTITMIVLMCKEDALLRDSYVDLKEDHVRLYQLAFELEVANEKRIALIEKFRPEQEKLFTALSHKAQLVADLVEEKAKLLREGVGHGDDKPENLNELERRHDHAIGRVSEFLKIALKDFNDLRELAIWHHYDVLPTWQDYVGG